LRDSARKNKEEIAMADDARVDVESAEEVIALWPTPPARTNPDVPPEQSFKGPVAGGAEEKTILRNVSHPTLTVYRPTAKANGVGVIVAPGGGWRILAWDHEGVDLCHWLAERGYTAFLLKYRLMGTPADPAEFAETSAKMQARLTERFNSGKPRPSIDELLPDPGLAEAREIANDDGRRALALVRERASEFGVQPDRVGMIGFSAGAFVTAAVAMDPGASPLAFAAPIYGGTAGGKPVPADAPPLFLCIAYDDQLLLKSVEGLYADWSKAGRPAEVHIFARGGHGFGTVKRGMPVDRWVDLFGDWLADLGLA
jgi:acetyl esterase/lipase